MILISSITETKCKASCTDVLYNNTVCRGVSIDDGRCLLDMGQDIYYSIPDLVNAVSYDTYIRVCHRGKDIKTMAFVPGTQFERSRHIFYYDVKSVGLPI